MKDKKPLTLKINEAIMDFYFNKWRADFMDSPRPGQAPPSFIQYLELQIHADTNYRIVGRDLIQFIKRIGGKDETAQG